MARHAIACARNQPGILSQRRRTDLPAVSAGLSRPGATTSLWPTSSPIPPAQLFVERIAQSSGPFQLSAERGTAGRRHLPPPRRHRARDRARRGARQCVWNRGHGLPSRQPLFAAMARTTHRHSATPDAQRCARLELRSPSPIRERHPAEIIGLRRPFTRKRLPPCLRRWLSASETMEAIDNLVTKSLIAPSGARALRYRLLDTTRTYALGK